MAYTPERDDVIWLDFNPQAGREQAKRRPAIVLSSFEYNAKVRLAIVCPITSKIKGYPFEVALPSDLKVSGVILSDQIKSLDWQTRNAELICKAPATLTAEVMAKLKTLLPA